jgi:hypothetical protein
MGASSKTFKRKRRREQGGIKMTFDKRIEQLSADQLLELIKRIDCEKNYPYVGATDFERVAFYIGIGGEKELAHVVEKWAEENLNMEFEKGFVYMYREPGVYALTTEQDGAYEGKRLVLPAIEVIEWLLHAGGTLEEGEHLPSTGCVLQRP